MSNYLLHYASPYYDPVKAHEYYMRTRELKGRTTTTRPTSKLSDEGKEIWKVTKDSIKTEKKEKVDAAKNEQKSKTEQLRSNASESRQRISEKLKSLNEILTARAAEIRKSANSKKESDLDSASKEYSTKSESIENKTNSAIKQLMDQEIPKGISKDERAKLIAERDEKIQKLRDESASEKAKASDELHKGQANANTSASSKKEALNSISAEKKSNSQNAATERQQVASELKSAVSAAREAYKKSKTDLNSTYEEIYQREYDAIASRYAKQSKRKSKKS